ncbi:hypothetical protein G5I_09835 [Acromyrmex echinatior]|uniref:Uncharacterized protein n=1 Tax=Acromyrmex echinatior TaxID=103372 RepID=F4WV44_ACREC|nr:hypothetical protein G5I_09835 [Acromyrmex echinatior]
MIEPQPVRRVACLPGVPFKLSDSNYSPRAIILFASVLRECPVQEDVNPILRGGGDLGETWAPMEQSCDLSKNKFA